MSLISDRHNVNLFVAGESKPLTGQRLAKVGYKSSKDKKTGVVKPAEFPSICVSVPKLDDSDIRINIDALLPHLRTKLEDAQDDLIRNLYETAGGNLSSVGDSEINLYAIISWLESDSGSRIKVDAVKSWFAEYVQTPLFTAIAIAKKFHDITPEVTATVDKFVNGYRELFCTLATAGDKTLLTTVQLRSLRTALELSLDDSPIGDRLMQKIEVQEKKEQFEAVL